MRKSFLETLTKLAKKDPMIIFIVGDVGFSFIEDFRERFPKQFKNIGAAEQKMMNFAVGMANEGFKPYVYTMANFILLRPHEQVRNNICHANKNVKLFGVKGSEAYSFLGISHNLEEGEEERIVTNWPNINYYVPKTEEETIEVILKEYDRQGPSYVRL